MSTAHLNPPARRIVIVMDGGLVQSVLFEGEGLADVGCYVIDYDTECADDSELVTIGDDQAVMVGHGLEPASEEFSRDFRRAYGAWVLS